MHEYFEEEMAMFQESAQHFAQQYPEKSHLFDFSNARNRDPYVERLFSGVAFLNAKLRQDLDRNLDNIADAVLEQHWPQVLLDRPAVMMVQADASELTEPMIIKKHSPILKTPPLGPEKTVCHFSTVSEETVLPLVLESAEYVSGSQGVLNLKFKVNEDFIATIPKCADKIKFHLCGDEAVALSLYPFFFWEVQDIFLNDLDAQCLVRLGGQEVIKASNLSENLLSIVESSSPLSKTNVLLDFLNYREKFCFFEMSGVLDAWKNCAWDGDCFRIKVIFNRAVWDRDKILTENIKINCFPVLNCFLVEAEPLQALGNKIEYPVIVDAEKKDSLFPLKIYDMEGHRGNDRFHVAPLHEFSLNDKGSPGHYYSAKHARLKTGSPAKMHLKLHLDLNAEEVNISYRSWAHNGDYPFHYIHSGLCFRAKVNQHQTVMLRSLARPTRSFYPFKLKGSTGQWIAQLSLNFSDLAEVSHLKKMLAMHIGEDPAGLLQKKYVESIHSVDLKMMDLIQKNIMKSQMVYTMAIDETKFMNTGELALFGAVLHEFLKMFVPMNQCFQLVVQGVCDGKAWVY